MRHRVDAVALQDGDRFRPLPSLVRVAPARDAAHALLHAGERSLRSLLDALRVAVIDEPTWTALDPARRTLFDVDEPGDLASPGPTRRGPTRWSRLRGEERGGGATRASHPLSKGRKAMTRRVLIMGAAGRDFHNFNTVYRDDADTEVVAFTATQIPFINDRKYPAELAGPHYPNGIQIHDESELTDLITTLDVDDVVFSYSDVSHEYVMHKASEAMAAGANFLLLGPDATMLDADVPVVSVCAVRTGSGKSQTTRAIAGVLKDAGKRVVAVRHPMPYGDLNAQRVQRYATARGPRPVRDDDRGARGVRAAHLVGHDHLRRRRLRRHPRAGAGGVRRPALGRREQRPAVLPADRERRGRRSAACRPRDDVLPGRDQHPDGRRDRRQQGGLRHRRAARRAGRDDRARSTRTRPSCGRTAGSRSTSRTRSRASGSW